MVDNFKAWNVFTWGEHIWRELYTAIRNVNSKHKDAHHKALEIGLNFVSSYSLSGFVLCFKDKVETVDAFDDLVDANTKLEEVDKDLSQQEAYQRRLRLQLILEEKNSMKSIDRNNSTHMKLALEKCRTTKRSTLIFGYGTCGILDNPVNIGQWSQENSVFVSKGIDPTHYSIKFRHAQNVPKQGEVFGDCGIFVCLFLYRLDHGIPLDVKDPIQTVLAYQEKMINLYFDHKIIFSS
nr:phospholipase-like protein [Tanacetum cinerariifolium]